jgi:hypothetical protein
MDGNYLFTMGKGNERGNFSYSSYNSFANLVDRVTYPSFFGNAIEHFNIIIVNDGPIHKLSVPYHSDFLDYLFTILGSHDKNSSVEVTEQEDRTIFKCNNIILEAMGKPRYEIL